MRQILYRSFTHLLLLTLNFFTRPICKKFFSSLNSSVEIVVFCVYIYFSIIIIEWLKKGTFYIFKLQLNEEPVWALLVTASEWNTSTESVNWNIQKKKFAKLKYKLDNAMVVEKAHTTTRMEREREKNNFE